MKWRGFIFGALLFGGLSNPVRAETHLTLDGSIALAIRQATSVLKAHNQDELSATTLLQAYAQFLPNLQASGSLAENNGKVLYTFVGTDLVDSRYLNATLQIGSTLNLFNGFSDMASLKASLERRDAAHLSLSWARQQIAIDVAQSYLQAILDQEVLNIATRNLAASRARLKLIRGQVTVGSASTADLFRQQAQTSSDEQYLVSSETRLHDDLLALIQRLALDTASEYSLEVPSLQLTDTALVSQPEPALIAAALSQRQDLSAQLSTVQAARWDISTAKAPYYPRLDFTFNRVAAGTILNHLLVNGEDSMPPTQVPLGPQLGQQVEYTIGLNLSWTLFDRLETRLGVHRAEVTADNARLDYEDLRRQVIADVRRSRADFESVSKQAESARVGVDAATKADSVIEARYRVGSSSFIDVLTAQSALVQAQVADAQARISLKLEEMLLRYSTGELSLPAD